MSDLEKKIDHLILLLEEQSVAPGGKCQKPKQMIIDLITNTVLASMLGYFMFRIMDHHFGNR